MNKNESVVRNVYEKKGYEVIHTNSSRFEKGFPDFKIFNFNTGERFFLEVKTQYEQFLYTQIKTFIELIKEGNKLLLAVVYPNIIKIYSLDEQLNKTKIENIKIPKKTIKKTKKCDNCGYEWETIVEDPISCPRCKRRFDYINKG